MNSYAPGFFGFAPPGYVFSSYSLGGFKFQGTVPPEENGAAGMQAGGGQAGNGGAGGGEG